LHCYIPIAAPAALLVPSEALDMEAAVPLSAVLGKHACSLADLLLLLPCEQAHQVNAAAAAAALVVPLKRWMELRCEPLFYCCAG
jgi:hypothetical protein